MNHEYKDRAYFEPIVNALGALKTCFMYFEIAGSWRRLTRTLKDIDVVCVCESDAQYVAIGAWITNHGVKVYGAEDRLTAKIDIDVEVLGKRIQATSNVDFRIHYTLDEWPSGLLHFTGSKEHNIKMRSRAKAYGFKLNEYGLWQAGQEDERIVAPSEAEIFSVLGMPYVPPYERR